MTQNTARNTNYDNVHKTTLEDDYNITSHYYTLGFCLVGLCSTVTNHTGIFCLPIISHLNARSNDEAANDDSDRERLA